VGKSYRVLSFVEARVTSDRGSPHGEGYVKVYRKLLTSRAFQDEGTLKVWIWCLLRANYQPVPIEFGGESIDLEPGQFITGTFSASDELRMAKSRVWRILDKLKKWGNIEVKSGNRFTVITVCNYYEYQNLGTLRELSGKLSGNKREPVGNPSGTDKKQKNQENQKPQETQDNSGFLQNSHPLRAEART
jgi:hypothetical protein